MLKTDDITGHKRQLAVLESMIRNSMIPQALLYTGMTGIGKYRIATWFIQAMFCPGDPRPCGSCSSCVQIEKKTFPDLIEIRPNDKGKIPIGDPAKREPGTIRWLIERLSKKSLYGQTGVIIDNADVISTEGQNALLKTIEEPHAGVHIILTASNKSRLLQTILSRCTIMSFNPLSAGEIREILTKKHADVPDLDIVSQISGGSVETAEILLNQEIKEQIFGLCRAVSSHVTGRTAFDYNITELLKVIPSPTLLTVLTNIYESMLACSLKNTESPLPRDIHIHDTAIIRKIIKILLALRKGLSNNLNVKIALKGMLYSLSEFDETIDVHIPSILSTIAG